MAQFAEAFEVQTYVTVRGFMTHITNNWKEFKALFEFAAHIKPENIDDFFNSPAAYYAKSTTGELNQMSENKIIDQYLSYKTKEYNSVNFEKYKFAGLKDEAIEQMKKFFNEQKEETTSAKTKKTRRK